VPLKEHRFEYSAGSETHLFVVEEWVKGLAVWPRRFRVRLPASSRSEAKTFYGATCYEAAEKAASFLAGKSDRSETARATRLSQRSPASPPHQNLQIQKIE
jgi:hypothetical protein